MDNLETLDNAVKALQQKSAALQTARDALLSRIRRAELLAEQLRRVEGWRANYLKMLDRLPAATREQVVNGTIRGYYLLGVSKEHGKALVLANVAEACTSGSYLLTGSGKDAVEYLRNPSVLDNEAAKIRAEIAAWLEAQRKTVATVKASLTVPDAEAEALGDA
jgi:hypothetical protein